MFGNSLTDSIGKVKSKLSREDASTGREEILPRRESSKMKISRGRGREGELVQSQSDFHFATNSAWQKSFPVTNACLRMRFSHFPIIENNLNANSSFQSKSTSKRRRSGRSGRRRNSAAARTNSESSRTAFASGSGTSGGRRAAAPTVQPRRTAGTVTTTAAATTKGLDANRKCTSDRRLN